MIGFDDLPPGTQVTDQYAGQGVEFGIDPGGGTSILPVVRADANARSGTQVGDLGVNCGSEFCNFVSWIHSDTLRDHVRVWVGNYGAPGQSASVAVGAYDLSGDQIGSFVRADVAGGSGYVAPFDVYSADGDIAFVSIGLGTQAPPAPPIAIDDLTLYDPVTPPTPQFRVTLDPGYQPVGLIQGETVKLPLVIRRANGSTGALQFTLNGLTPGLSATFDPNPSNGGDGAVVMLTLTAAQGAQVTNGTLTLSVTPAPTAGISKKQLQVPFYIQQFDLYDARITGIEVTQGVQTIGTDSSVPARDPANPTAPVPYQGVLLQSGRKTIVRVFGNLRFGPSDGVIVYGKLRGFSGGRELPGSPLMPDDADPLSPGHRTLTPGGFDFTSTEARLKQNDAFTFTLPAQGGWRGGTVTLQAEIEGTSGRGVAECTDQICVDNNTFILSNVSYTMTGALGIVPIMVHVDGVPDPDDPWTVLDGVRTVTPYGLLPLLYRGVIDITKIVNDGDSRKDRSSDALDEVEDWDGDQDVKLGSMTMGVIGGSGGNSDLGISSHPAAFANRPISLVNEYRPLGSVAHEINHGLGRKHASGACGGGSDGQTAEGWPPDEQGFLQGVGIDTRPGSGGGTSEYRVFAAGGCGADGNCIFAPWRGCTVADDCRWFDFMAYTSCNKGGDEGGLWMSPKGWNEIINSYNTFSTAPDGADVARSAAVARDAAGDQLRVRVRLGDAGPVITKVGMAKVDPLDPPATSSPYHLVPRDAGGQPLADQPMTVRVAHVNDGGSVTSLQADVPPDGVQQVDVMQGNQMIATRTRSAHAPAVVVTTPHRIGLKPTVTLAWQVTDDDGDPTHSTIDFSADDGKTWRPLYQGATPSPTQVTLPRSLFSGTRRGRLRVRANDGFNDTTAVSSRFVVQRGTPVVKILSPVNDQMVIANGTLTLEGDALDDAATPIPSPQLRWYVGRKKVGVGREVDVTNLRPGHQTIRLLARSAGKAGKASVSIQVLAPQR